MSSYSALSSLLSSSSTSSIDISSILQAAFGSSSSGLDVTSAVSSAITAARAPENTWEAELSTLESQISALKSIQTSVSTLDSDMVNLNSVVGPLSTRTVSSSNSSLVTASAASGTSMGNHTVTVSNLATTASWASGVFSSSTTDLPAGNFTITTGSGSTATITTDGTQTLDDVVSQINAAGLGVTARVVTDASGARLAIVANASGSASNFTVTDNSSAGYGFSQAAAGQNASLTVDGIAISSASNTVTGAIPGVTLSLLGANSGTQVSLSVSQNTSSVESAINQFVSDYNSIITSLNSQFTFDGSSQGVLASDSTVRNLQSTMLGILSYSYAPSSGTTTVSNLSQLGITVNNDGTLSVDSSTLESMLQNNYSDVQSFFQGASSNGFANSLDQQLTSFTDSGDGAFTVDLQSMNSQVSDIEDTITNFEDNYITPLKTKLQSEYSQAEILLQQLPVEMQQINTMLGYNNKSSS